MNRFKLTTVVLFLFICGLNLSALGQDKEEAAIDGYCPVAYKKMGKAVKGKPDYAVTHEGETYYLLKAKAQKMFEKNPEKFLPKYDGYCATAIAKGKKVEAKGELFVIHNGQTYLFSSEKAMKMFKNKPNLFIEKADEEFAAMQE